MSYQLYDANGYVGDLASNGGMSDLEGLYDQMPDSVKAFLDEGHRAVDADFIKDVRGVQGLDADVMSILQGLADLLAKCDEVAIINDGTELEDVSSSQSFAEVRGTTGRRLPGRLEEATNDYQGQLVAAYDKWAARLTRKLTAAEKAGTPMSSVLRLVDLELPVLATELKALGRKSLPQAVGLGTAEKEPGTAFPSLIERLTKSNDDDVDAKLVPYLSSEIKKKLLEANTKTFQLETLLGGIPIMDKFRNIIAGGSGNFWLAIFSGAQEKAQSLSDTLAGKQRIRWELDPDAEHCQASEGYYGCPDLEGEYESFEELPTVPAGQVSCRGSCRCHLRIIDEFGNIWGVDEAGAWGGA